MTEARQKYEEVSVLRTGGREWCWSVGMTHWRLVGRLLQVYLPAAYSGRLCWTSLREAPSVEWAVAYSLGWEKASALPEIDAREQGEAEGGAE